MSYQAKPQMDIDIEKTFRKLAQQWREDCLLLSSAKRMAAHPAYQDIIGLGWPVVPLILRELEKKPEHWFLALAAITGENPVPKEDAGNLNKMAQAWLEFGRQRGYI